MAAASQKKRRTAAVHTTTKALKVRVNAGYLAAVFQAEDTFSDVEIL